MLRVRTQDDPGNKVGHNHARLSARDGQRFRPPDETSFVAAGLITDWPHKSPRALAGRFLRETGSSAVKYGGFRARCGYTVAAYSRPFAPASALFVHAKLLIGRRQTIIAQVSAFLLPFSYSGRLLRDDHVGLAASAERNQIIRDTT